MCKINRKRKAKVDFLYQTNLTHVCQFQKINFSYEPYRPVFENKRKLPICSLDGEISLILSSYCLCRNKIYNSISPQANKCLKILIIEMNLNLAGVERTWLMAACMRLAHRGGR